ncbi:unnamed protein product [Rotaria sp. Silwood2]|nr:unnamed protein product [Rotaria sp. Silwood2]
MSHCNCLSRLIVVMPNIAINARWAQNGVTVARELNDPLGFFVDDDQTIVIADFRNDRIVQWKMGDKKGQVVAGGGGKGNRLDQLNCPTDVLIDKETDSLIICDRDNRRVVRWPRHNGTTQGETLIKNITCYGLTMDEQRHLYVSDVEKHELVGNGEGAGLNQLSRPSYLFVDRQQTVYVSDFGNHRVMKWNEGAKEGIVVAGGQGDGNALTQLYYPNGLVADTLGTLYVADSNNHRVMRWPQGAKQGIAIVGENDQGNEPNQLNYPMGLFFDQYGNLYVVDFGNDRVQRFSLEQT